MILGSFQKQTRKMTTDWMEKIMPHCFDNFFADKENIYSRLFKICQSDTSNKVLTPISPNFYTLQTWNDNSNNNSNEDNKTKVEIFL